MINVLFLSFSDYGRVWRQFHTVQQPGDVWLRVGSADSLHRDWLSLEHSLCLEGSRELRLAKFILRCGRRSLGTECYSWISSGALVYGSVLWKKYLSSWLYKLGSQEIPVNKVVVIKNLLFGPQEWHGHLLSFKSSTRVHHAKDVTIYKSNKLCKTSFQFMRS